MFSGPSPIATRHLLESVKNGLSFHFLLNAKILGTCKVRLIEYLYEDLSSSEQDIWPGKNGDRILRGNDGVP